MGFCGHALDDVRAHGSGPFVGLRVGSIGFSLFLPYERNTDHVRMPAPVGSGGLG